MKIRDNLGQVNQHQNTVLVTVNIGLAAVVLMVALGFFWQQWRMK